MNILNHMMQRALWQVVCYTSPVIRHSPKLQPDDLLLIPGQPENSSVLLSNGCSTHTKSCMLSLSITWSILPVKYINCIPSDTLQSLWPMKINVKTEELLDDLHRGQKVMILDKDGWPMSSWQRPRHKPRVWLSYAHMFIAVISAWQVVYSSW